MYENRQRKALLKVGYACNNRCVFCHSAPLRGRFDASTEALLAKITATRLRGYEMVVFSGGEATIRPDLAQLVRRVSREGLGLGFVTNARRFAHAPFAEGMLARGLGYVYMSLHGARAETHDRLVAAHTYDQSVAAIRNLAGRPKMQLTVNTVVTGWNVDELEALVDLALEIGGLRLKFSYLEPKGDALDHLDQLLISPTAAATRIQAAIEHGLPRAEAAGVDLAWDALPPCLMRGHEQRYDDLLTNRIEVMSEADEVDFYPVDHLNKGKAPVCDGCARRATCPGLYHEALRRFGHEILRPYKT